MSIFDTEGITGAMVTMTIAIAPEELGQPRDDLKRLIRDDIGLKYFDIANIDIEFIKGRLT